MVSSRRSILFFSLFIDKRNRVVMLYSNSNGRPVGALALFLCLVNYWTEHTKQLQRKKYLIKYLIKCLINQY